MDVTPKPDREKFLNFTNPYLMVPHVIVAREDRPFHNSEEDLNGKTIALERGFGNIRYFRSNFPEVKVVEYETTAACLVAVSSGDVDAYAGNRAVVTYLIAKELLTNLQVQGGLSQKAMGSGNRSSKGLARAGGNFRQGPVNYNDPGKKQQRGDDFASADRGR